MENLDNALSDLINKSIQLAEKTGDFAIDQIPDLVQQLLTFKMIEYAFYVAILIVVLCVLVTSIALAVKPLLKNNDFEFDESPVIIRTIFTVVCVPFIPFVMWGLVMKTITLLKITIAPKLFLIEYAASLIKGH